MLKAQKSWVTGYAEAYVDDFTDMARQPASPAEPVAVAWMYEHDGGLNPPTLTPHRWISCKAPWNETALYASLTAAKAAQP